MKPLTPMMMQFTAVKKEHPDSILFFRMGDFYEMFGDDAHVASKILGITLTSRDKRAENETPMCGVPHHAYKQYALKLIKAGYKVAICDQLEDPALAKGIVRRGVVRIISSGTMMDDEELPDASNNFLVAVYADPVDGYYLAAADISTGEIYLSTADEKTLREVLESFEPQEVLSSTPLYIENAHVKSSPSLEDSLKLLRKIYKRDESQLGLYDRRLALPLAMIAGYVEENLLQVSFSPPVVLAEESRLIIDQTAANTLELVKSNDAGGKSLFDVLNFTTTPMGMRMLKWWILHPLREVFEINRRLDAVEYFVRNWRLAESLRELLKEVSDIERIAARTASGRVLPRELVSLKNSLAVLPYISDILEGTGEAALEAMYENFNDCAFVEALISESIADKPEQNLTGGGIIRSGYNKQVDELRDIKENGRSILAKLEAELKSSSGINSLKISYNKVFGYYIEISKTQAHKVPANFERRQTLVNAERYVTPELKELENKILDAEERLGALEYELFCAVRQNVCENVELIRNVSRKISALDAMLSLAQAAERHNYVRPVISEALTLDVTAARHAVVEAVERESFVANDIDMNGDDKRLLLITGPNMSGKSTYIRSVALVVIMAHLGSFVPAKAAVVGLADRVFTRVGASDNISRGQSTFMVEMVETANILNNATDRSLVILDEIGRGTSTYDGLSIAWAVSEYLLETVKARSLFATHYHELTELGKRAGARNLTVMVKEQDDEVIFMRKIVEGTADKSYGIYVAQIAGLDKEVVKRATNILAELETGQRLAANPQTANISNIRERAVKQILIFDEEHPALKQLATLDVDNMTPIQALATLAELKLLGK